MSRTAILSSKPRYEILDGLRGVAAIMVVIFHLFETYSKGPCHQLVNHGYLAVDFFFILSGFVIGYAYDDRWGRNMSQWDFYKRRLIRLEPMVIMGLAIGGFLFYFGDAPWLEPVMQTPWWKLLLLMILGCFMFPTPPSLDIRGWGEINAINGPIWSLMFEYVANILYATVVRHFSKVVLTAFVAASALMTVDICLNIDVFGILAPRSSAAYTVIGGFGMSWEQLYIGVGRLLYPFFGGLLLYRLGWRLNIGRQGFLWLSVALMAIMAMPHLGGDTPNIANGLFCAVAILLFFPAIVAAGAGSPLAGRRMLPFCKWLGAISYPLYITHYPLIYMQMSWASRHPDAPLSTHIWVAVSILIVAIAIAYACLKVYDEPVRQWLTGRFLRRNKS